MKAGQFKFITSRVMYKTQKFHLILFGIITIVFLYLLCVLYYGIQISFNENQFEIRSKDDKYQLVDRIKAGQDPKPLNHFNASFSHYPRCEIFTKKESENLFITVLVISSCQNFKHRVAIRKTWAYKKLFTVNEKISLNTIFVVGSARNTIEQMFIDGEFENFKDILQVNMEETPFNMTMISFEYAVKECKATHFFMIVDENYFISLKNVVRFLTNPLEYPGYFKHIELAKIFSRVMLYAGSVTGRKVKYVDGGAALYSTEAFQEIYYTSLYVKPLENINEFIGTAAYFADIDPVGLLSFKKTSRSVHNRMASFYNDLISVNGFENSEDILKLWRVLGYKLGGLHF